MRQHSGSITETVVPAFSLSSWQKGLSDPVQLADWLLRIAVVVHIAGLTMSLFARSGSAIGGVALMQWGISDDVIFLAERVVSAVLLLAAISLLVYPTGIVLALIGGAIAAEAYAITEFGGNPFYEYALVAHVLRFLLPLAVILLVSLRGILPDERKRIAATTWILRIGLAAVFFVHGLEAWWHNPQFVDLIIGSATNVFGLRVGEGQALNALSVIGVVDMIVAVMLVLRPSRPLLIWLCFWGLITALSRPFSMGIGVYTEVLVRVSHFFVPVILWLLLFSAKVAAKRDNVHQTI